MMIRKGSLPSGSSEGSERHYDLAPPVDIPLGTQWTHPRWKDARPIGYMKGLTNAWEESVYDLDIRRW